MTFNGTLHENVYILSVAHPAANDEANFPLEGKYIDVSDYNRFAFVVQMGSFDTDGDFRVLSASTQSGATVAISGAEKTDLDHTADDNKWFSIEVETVKLPSTHSYVTLYVATFASNDLSSALFMGWECRHGTPTQSSGYDSHTVVAG